MIQIVEIENALKRINGDIFQEFCNHYLYLKLNPNTITPIGSVIGKEKSRKGIPDSYLTNAFNELIFAEYTSQERLKSGESFFKKLESDIENCFDTSKTGIKKEEIVKVILCFTERIKPDEKRRLDELCKKHNPNCELELKGIRDLAYAIHDYPALGDYLGIKIGSGQIQEPSYFIENYEKNRISTPLSNAFLGREKDIEKGLELLTQSDILLVHGVAGAGKSKYSIELAMQYSEKNNFQFFCIGNKGVSIWEDLKSTIKQDKKYVLLVDDANRLTQNFQLILSLLKERAPNSLKLIVTVRDYAFQKVKNIVYEFYYSTIEICLFSDEEIKKIIQSNDFRIDEPFYLDRIVKVAKGNPRLAIMYTKTALKSKNILDLKDASQIYDEYFEPLFNEVDILKEPTTQKTLSIISFFSRIDINNREFCNPLFNQLNIDENKFWETCYSLHEYELVDLFEHQVVKISDQIFATYIFYKTVIENGILNFNFFLDNYLNYENRITDTIFPVLKTFDYKHIEKKLKPTIQKKWTTIEKEGSYENSIKFLKLFWFYLSPQVFTFLKKRIDKQEPTENSEYKFSYELNEFSFGTGDELEILSNYRGYIDYFIDALELMFYFAIRVPSKMPAVVYTVKEKFNFSRHGYIYRDYIQHTLIDFLIKNAQNSQNKEVYEKILSEILPSFLKIEFNEDEGNGRTITLYTFHLCLSESISDFRQKCFNYLLFSASKTNVLNVLYRLNYYEYKNSKEILKHDLPFLYQIICRRLNGDNFEDCFVLQNITEGLDWLCVDYTNEIKNKYNSKLFQLAEVLKSDRRRIHELSIEEEEKKHQKELQDYCDGFSIDNYFILLSDISSILEYVKKGNLEWQYEHSLKTIFGNLAQEDSGLFIEVLKLNFNKFHFNLNYIYIFNIFFQFNPQFYFELFEQIQDLENDIKFCYHQTIKIEVVKEEHLSLLYENLVNSIKSIDSQYFFWDLTFVSKYKKIKDERDIYLEILDIILTRNKEERVRISVGKKFIKKCLDLENFPISRIIEAYLYSDSFEQHFDYDKKVLRQIIELDSYVIIRLLKFNSKVKISYHDLGRKNFDFIWELDNYSEIIGSIFEYFMTSETTYFAERAIASFFPKSKVKYSERPIKYIEKLIDEKSQDVIYMNVVFSIICYKYPEQKMEFLERFLKLNIVFEDFRSLEIIQKNKSWSGSYIPILENEKEIWRNVISVIERLPNRLEYYEHKEYATMQIGYCDLRIRDEMKREFYEADR